MIPSHGWLVGWFIIGLTTEWQNVFRGPGEDHFPLPSHGHGNLFLGPLPHFRPQPQGLWIGDGGSPRGVNRIPPRLNGGSPDWGPCKMCLILGGTGWLGPLRRVSKSRGNWKNSPKNWTSPIIWPGLEPKKQPNHRDMAVFGQFAMIAVSGTDRNFLEPLASPAMRTDGVLH